MIQIAIALFLLGVTWLCPLHPAAVQLDQGSTEMVVVVDDQEYRCSQCNPLIFGMKINVNDASLEVLENLPSIGVHRAAQIVDWREERGPFKDIAELQDIKGIGPKTVTKIQPYIKLH